MPSGPRCLSRVAASSQRCYITELINDAQWSEVSLARCRVEPGVTTQLHELSVHEVYVIEKGNGRMYVGNSAPYTIGPGDTVSISKHTPQCVQNAVRSERRRR
jgi:mannose-6-phosphate isomerase-like protein (cupin superfamily)